MLNRIGDNYLQELTPFPDDIGQIAPELIAAQDPQAIKSLHVAIAREMVKRSGQSHGFFKIETVVDICRVADQVGRTDEDPTPAMVDKLTDLIVAGAAGFKAAGGEIHVSRGSDLRIRRAAIYVKLGSGDLILHLHHRRNTHLSGRDYRVGATAVKLYRTMASHIIGATALGGQPEDSRDLAEMRAEELRQEQAEEAARRQAEI